MNLRPWADVRITDSECEVYCKLCKDTIKNATEKYLSNHEDKIRHNTLFKKDLKKDLVSLSTNSKYRIQKFLIQ